jgi:hypothetical protein
MTEAVANATPPRAMRRRAVVVAWRVLAGTAAGAVVGLVIGGIGGRLAMLLLRLTTPGSVAGLVSDDGFEMGVVSRSTFVLLFTTTALGAINGALYAGLRGAIAPRLRLPLWTALGALVGGGAIVHADGVDFNLLAPAALAVALFVAIPAVGAATIVLLAERWSRTTPWQGRRLTVGLLVAVAAAPFAIPVAVAVGAILLVVSAALEQAGPSAQRVRRAAGVVVPVALVAVAVLATVDLVGDIGDILE